MVYQKKYKRPGYRACGRMVASDASKALTIARGIKRILNVEVKNFDVKSTSLAITDTASIIQLSNIPQGDGTTERDGNQCKMVGLQLSYHLQQNASATIPTFVRVILIIDKQTNGAIFTSGTFLADVSTQDNIVSPRNLNTQKRFTVLQDLVHVLNTGGPDGVIRRKYFSKEVLLRYSASTPSIADLTQSSLALLVVASSVTNDPSFTLNSRLRFVDN